MLTITQLEYILAVDRLRHFGRAAKACHVSQPSLSMLLKKAEDVLGIAIFDRDRQPIVPTDAGKVVIEQARVVLREMSRLIEESTDAKNEVRGHYNLAVIPTIAPYLVPLFVRSFAAHYPKVDLVIEEQKTAEIILGLQEDRFDGAILATPLHEKGLIEEALYYEPFYVYCHPDHPLAKRKRIDADELDGSDMWMLNDGHCFRSQIIKFCSMRHDRRSVMHGVQFESGNFETLRNLVKMGSGYTLVPHLFIQGLSERERLRSVRPLAAPIPVREIALVHRRNHVKQQISQALFKEVRRAVPVELLEEAKNAATIDPI